MTSIKSKFWIGALIIGGIFSGYFFGTKSGGMIRRTECVSKLNLIKRNIDCDSYDETIDKLSSLEEKLDVLIAGYKKTAKVKRMSVFVRDLNTSRFAGYNDNDIYYMASLLKTPLLIAGFKLAEVEPRVLDQVISYDGIPNLYGDQVVKVDQMLIAGNSYSIKELMNRSVIYSDNTAAQILYDYYPPEFLDRIQQALGIQVTRPTGEPENLITARTYANMFRILFNASYLTKEYSNEALNILTKTTYNNGATSKLPKEVKVAHKFAERTLVYSDASVAIRQFHECGIVYAEKGDKPYSFCIMTEGEDYKTLEEVIANTSLIIYDEMIND